MNLSIEEQASQWMAKLDAETPSKETFRGFKAWVNADPAHRQAFEEMIEFWDDMNVLTQAQLPREMQGAVYGNQQQDFSVQSADIKQKSGLLCLINNQSRYALASIFAFGLMATVAFFQWGQTTASSIYTTQIGEQKTIQLSDNSTMMLNTNSQVEVSFSKAKRQLTLLQGEAHFEVSHNPGRPFEVYAGNGLVRAIGTAFTVHLRKVDVEVIVTEGTVEIDNTEPEDSALSLASLIKNSDVGKPPVSNKLANVSPPVAVKVKAGNSVVYDRELLAQVETAVANQLEERLAWQTGMLVFDGEPLSALVDEVGRYTKLKIVIPERKVRELKVGGLFKVGDTDALFEALRDGFDVHVQHVSKDMVYLISSENRQR
jgi:transmembrane sensor